MDYYKNKFWDDYKKELIDPIEVLIDNNKDVAAAKLILSGIDSLAGFYAGRISSGLVKDTFLDFIGKYMPAFDSNKFTGSPLINSKTNKQIKCPSEILFYIFRNDLIHDGTLGIGVSIYRDKNIGVLWTGWGIEIFKINIIGFFEYYKKAIDKYREDLNVDSVLMENFSKKYDIVTGLLFGD